MEYNKKEFEQIYRTYYKLMYRMAYSITDSADDSRDAVGHVFAKMWKNQPNISDDKICGYLLSATRNQSITMKRKRLLTKEIQEEFLWEQSCERKIEHEELVSELNRVIREQLTEKDRQILLMHYDDGLDYHQTAEILGISYSAVNKHISKSLSKIRSMLGIYK